MEHPSIFAATLGLSHTWQITSLSLGKEANRMDITINFVGDCQASCPICNSQGKTCDFQHEIWYHSDFFNYKTYLHARVPVILCPCCGKLAIARPWSGAGSKFSLLDTATAA